MTLIVVALLLFINLPCNNITCTCNLIFFLVGLLSPSPTSAKHPLADTYCFEMLSMVLALSGSAVGRTHLAHQDSLLRHLLSLLHTGSARVQRQVPIQWKFAKIELVVVRV